MHKKVYIDGNFLLKSGIFYGLNFIMNANESYKNLADEILPCNEDGFYEISEDGGSIFNEYYVKGEIAMHGENGSSIIYFKKEHEDTYQKYKEIQSKIIQLLDEAIIPDNCKNYFYQQQYISLIANLEYFLYSSFMWETCQNYNIYKTILNAHLSFLEYKEAKSILRGEHCILQEKTFLEQIKFIIYHNAKQVNKLYNTAFNVDVNLDVLKDEIDIRNDIAHRAGHTKKGEQINISKEQVILLKDKIDTIVENITREIAIFKESNFITS